MRCLPPIFAALLLCACAHGGERLERVALTDKAWADPWEDSNRRVYAFSNQVDRAVLLPVTNAYRSAVPAAARRGTANGYNNLREPTYFANALLQGKVKRAFRALDRLLVNGVLGLGLSDHATDMGLPSYRHDFGQTMAVWGVPSGPFIMLPFLGPSTVRDGIGFFVDFFADPVNNLENRLFSQEEQILELGVRVLDIRSGLRDQGEQLLAGAADPYATIRSAWLQRRRFEIFDGAPPDDDDLLDTDLSLSEPATAPSAPPAADAEPAPERVTAWDRAIPGPPD